MPDPGPPDAVEVWLVDLAGPGYADLRALLDPDESRRCAGMLPAEGRRYAVAHGATRQIVADRLGTDPRELRWEFGPNGKPALAGAALQVNLSHSGGYAMVAVSAPRPVGVDVQQVLAGHDVTAMAARFFPVGEAALVGGPRAPERFAELWTRKEALVKAAGDRLVRGLAVPVAGPSPLVVAYGDRYRITDLDAPEGYRAAVALAGGEPFTVRVRRHASNPARQR